MTPKSITHAELHKLVWTEPQSKLAPAWGVSDGAIGKLCVRVNVPAPPPWYWAKKAAGGHVRIPPSPMRLPGQRELVELRQSSTCGRWNEPIDLERETELPTYAEHFVHEVQFAAIGAGRVLECNGCDEAAELDNSFSFTCDKCAYGRNQDDHGGFGCWCSRPRRALPWKFDAISELIASRATYIAKRGGALANHKRVCQIYRQLELSLRFKPRKRLAQ